MEKLIRKYLYEDIFIIEITKNEKHYSVFVYQDKNIIFEKHNLLSEAQGCNYAEGQIKNLLWEIEE